MIELLNKCFLSPKEPSFYDMKAKSTAELLSNFHAKLNELVSHVNDFTTQIEKDLETFEENAEKAKKEHMSAMRQEFQDFIDVVNLKIDGFRGEIEELKKSGSAGGLSEDDVVEIVERVIGNPPTHNTYTGQVEVE